MTGKNANKTLFICNFLSKGWEVSILGFLAFIQKEHGIPLYMVGILSSVFIITQITISFFAGRIAHAIHSRNVVFLSIAASGVSWFALFFSSHLAMLFLAYAFGGVSSGLFEPIGNSLVAKLSPSGNRSTAIGNSCLVMFGSSVTALILAYIAIAKTNGEADSVPEEMPVHLGDLLKNRKFCFATAAGIADSFSSASLYIFIPFLLTAKGIPLENTLYFNVIFFAGYMSGRLLLGRLADKHGAPNILMGSKVAMALLILLLTLVSGSALLLALLFLLGIFTRGSSPIIRAMVADTMDENISFHNAFSAFSSASRGSSALSRPIYGFLASFAGIASVFYLASAVSLLTLYPAAKYKRQ
jgi:FSR family fosmidomycin resistance protein-like MFS transporter